MGGAVDCQGASGGDPKSVLTRKVVERVRIAMSLISPNRSIGRDILCLLLKVQLVLLKEFSISRTRVENRQASTKVLGRSPTLVGFGIVLECSWEADLLLGDTLVVRDAGGVGAGGDPKENNRIDRDLNPRLIRMRQSQRTVRSTYISCTARQTDPSQLFAMQEGQNCNINLSSTSATCEPRSSR